jgi:Saccharopine dehydrogenase NADP binding domain
MSGMPSSARVVLLGGGGHMLRATAHALAEHVPEVELLLVDRDAAALARRLLELERARGSVVDLDDSAALHSALAGARLVIHGAGPFRQTAARVRRACIELGVDYLDLDDELESTRDALALDAQARSANVRLFVGCGVSPGLTNLLALDALAELDRVERIEVAWCVGEEEPLGRAVAEHALHLGAGDCLAIEAGRRVVRRSMERSRCIELQRGAAPRRLYETAHPEPEQFAHSHPQVADIVCWGGLDPAPMNGLLKGVALAVREGRWSEDEACSFLESVSRGRIGSARGWQHALSGLASQWRSRELRAGELLRLGVRRQGGRNGLCAQAWGVRRGERIVVNRQLAQRAPGACDTSMAQATGLAAAAFASAALRATGLPGGTLFPQMWASPHETFAMLKRFGLTEVVVGWREPAPAPARSPRPTRPTKDLT